MQAMAFFKLDLLSLCTNNRIAEHSTGHDIHQYDVRNLEDCLKNSRVRWNI